MKFFDMKDMHPLIANRRRSVRRTVAYVEVFDNGDIEYKVEDSFRSKASSRFIATKLEHAKNYIAKALENV